MESSTILQAKPAILKSTRWAQSTKRGLSFPFRRPLRCLVVLLGVGGLAFMAHWGARCSTFRGHLDEARRAASVGRSSAAVYHLERCQEIDADNREVMLLVAEVARVAQNWPRAEEVLEHYWRLYGYDDRLTFERLLLKAARDETASVLTLLNLRLRSGGESARSCRHALASGYIREFQYIEAQAVLDSWLGEFPEDPQAKLLLGKLLDRQFKYRDAAETYASIVVAHADHHEARLALALMLMQQRKADEALRHLTVLRTALPDSSEVAVQWAVALREIGRSEDAIRALDEALLRHPDSATALTERATLALNSGEDRLAAELLAKSLRVEPGSVGGRNLYVQALTRLGRAEEVTAERQRVKILMADSDRLTELTQGPLLSRPNDPEPPFEIGGIALRAGQPSGAIRWYEAALKRDQNHAPSHLALTVIYHEMGNPVMATKHRALAASVERRR